VSIKISVKEIKFELDEIENLFDLYREELFELNREPNQVEITALASVLHSFYCGIEKIFLIIAKRIDKSIPYDLNWHKTLLFQMMEKNEFRDAVISDKTKEELSDYLAFRHLYRHSYSSRLKWREMEFLVTSIHQTWIKFRSEISLFIKALESKE
jgi:hypothetical protein